MGVWQKSFPDRTMIAKALRFSVCKNSQGASVAGAKCEVPVIDLVRALSDKIKAHTMGMEASNRWA